MKPLCVAARTALLIDPDKSVRPCCSYGVWGGHIPASNGIAKLESGTSLQDIVQSEPWQRVRAELDAGKVPRGCATCMARERSTGYGLRHFYDSPNWDKGLTFLELNTSNLCTLQCRHCCGFCSHRWALELGQPVFKPDSGALLQSLRHLDLSNLERIMFKGGEPLMNSDVEIALTHLRDIGRLSRVSVSFVTNGTIIDPKHMELLSLAKHVHWSISVDGVGKVQTYIRHGKSELAGCERFIAAYHEKLPFASFSVITSIMAYNVLSLESIANWWRALSERYPGRLAPISFYHFVVDPPHLAVHVLRESQRRTLAAHYRAKDPELYSNVIRMLEVPSAPTELRETFLAETRRSDRILGNAVQDSIPELAEDFAT